MTTTLIPTDLYDPHVAARAKIDEEITQLEARLVLLRSARNALAPITRLHPDIIQEIFSLVHQASPRKGHGALLLTWISHNWREIAHNTSTIWSHINFTHPQWVKTALSRTKGCVLEFDLNTTSTSKVRSLITLIPYTLGNLSRTKKLRVVSRFDGNNIAFPKDAPEWLIPAPLLVELHLEGVILPQDVFSGTFPSLRTLYMREYSADWDKLPVTPGLRNLSLAYPKTPATVDDVLKLFRVIGPGLETLELNNVFFRSLTAGSSLYRDRFNFESLKSLKLSQGANQAALLLDQISLPHRLNIAISTGIWVQSNISDSLLSCRGIENWLADHLEINIPEMRLRIVEVLEDSMSDGDGTGPTAIDNNTTYVQFEVQSDQTSSHFLHMFNSVPVQPTKKISFVGGHGELQDLTVLSYIGRLGTIQELRIEHSFMPTFIELMKEQDAELHIRAGWQTELDITLARTIMLFHKLQVLEVYCEGPHVPSISDEDIVALQKWLDWRKRVGLQLAKLSVSRLKTPPISWMNGVFHEIVDIFQSNDLEERQLGNDEEDLE